MIICDLLYNKKLITDSALKLNSYTSIKLNERFHVLRVMVSLLIIDKLSYIKLMIKFVTLKK